MSFTVDLLVKARQDLHKAREWYEEKQPGLGGRFAKEVFRKIDIVKANPLHYPQKNGFREAGVKTFPFLIVFTIDKNTNILFVVSIFHMSRHPKRKSL
jgi:mRNA-degrading endonuclease RelE of RelBE toxin-antitoxin system